MARRGASARSPRREARRRSGRRSALAAAALLATCCAWLGRGSPYPPLALQRNSYEVIGHAEDVELKLVNRGAETLRVAWPPEPFLLVRAAVEGGRRAVACSSPPPVPARIAAVALRPGGELSVRLDLTRLCAVAPRQRFGVQVWYSVPEEARGRPGGREVWTGTSAEAALEVAPSPEAAAVPDELAPVGPRPVQDAAPATPPPR